MNIIDQNKLIISSQCIEDDEKPHQLLESRVDKIGRIYLKQQTPDGKILVRVLAQDNSITVLSPQDEAEAETEDNPHQLLECFIDKCGAIFLKQRTPGGIILDCFLGLNNILYIGQFESWKGHGQGKLITDKNGIYEGQFEDGIPQGWGKVIMPDGFLCEGKYEEGEAYGIHIRSKENHPRQMTEFENGVQMEDWRVEQGLHC